MCIKKITTFPCDSLRPSGNRRQKTGPLNPRRIPLVPGHHPQRAVRDCHSGFFPSILSDLQSAEVILTQGRPASIYTLQCTQPPPVYPHFPAPTVRLFPPLPLPTLLVPGFGSSLFAVQLEESLNNSWSTFAESIPPTIDAATQYWDIRFHFGRQPPTTTIITVQQNDSRIQIVF